MITRKIALIIVDGMRPDGMLQANTPTLKRLMAKGAYSLNASTVLPGLTLPCITSLILGVRPQTHGTLTNNYASMHWEEPGLIDLLHAAGLKTASFINWEQLRDLSRPGSLDLFICTNTSESITLPLGESDRKLTSLAILALQQQQVDFIFLYLGGVDTAGHKYGWMSPEYLNAIEIADDCIDRFLAENPGDITLCVTADHGGIGKSHGSDSLEEMQIPFILVTDNFPQGKINSQVSILDIAPTLATCAGVTPPPHWEGQNLFSIS